MSNEFVEKDSKIGYILTIIVLIITVFGLLGYIVYDGYFKEEKPVIKEVFKREETRELSFSHTLDLIEKIKVYNSLLYNNYLVDEVSELNSSDYYYFAYNVLLMEDKDITVENVKNTLMDYFGEDFTKLDDIICLDDNEVMYEYDEENNIYAFKKHQEHEISKKIDSEIRYISSVVDGNKVTIVTKNLYRSSFSDKEELVNAYYSDVDNMFNKENCVLGENSEEVILNDDLFESVLDELPETTYNFILEENGNYILKDISIEK